ncbi:MAG: hypothetical protein AAFR81_23875 [Chloroflexota bacterium]
MGQTALKTVVFALRHNRQTMPSPDTDNGVLSTRWLLNCDRRHTDKARLHVEKIALVGVFST